MPPSPPPWRAPLDRAARDATLAGVDPRLRLGRPSDARGVAALMLALADAEWARVPPDLAAHVAAFVRDPAPGFAVVVEGAGRLVAFATVQRLAAITTRGTQLCLDDLFVHPSCRRAGLGRALLRGVVAIAKATDAAYLYLHVRPDNDAARALYVAEGLTPGDDVLYEWYRG
jgi:GNAT superfamily N-acetyltransferase